MGNVAITVKKKGTKAELSNTGKIELYKNESLTITLDLASWGIDVISSGIDTVNFREESTGPTGAIVGNWKRDGTGVGAEGVTVAASGPGVVITDAGTNLEDYYYEVWVGAFKADPELVIKKKTRPPGSSAPAPDATP